ncbi:hypothetical protein [Nocardia brasiliensis]|uniref:hypothetical protein n=1 Tax=Nocardia brasiliensis TaxID=37326 RepID=UPI0024579C28|nr:hypothetical protein [Nocardia brasiliensis]
MANQAHVSSITSATEQLLAALVDRSQLGPAQVREILAALDAPTLDQFVIVCPGGWLYDDGDAPAGSGELLRPMLYTDRAEAERDRASLEADTADQGVSGWRAMVVRLRELTGPYPVQVAIGAEATEAGLDVAYPAPAPAVRWVFAIAVPGNRLHRTTDALCSGEPYSTWNHLDQAEAAAAELRADMARRGIADYPATVVALETVTTTGTWQIAA